MWHRLLNTYLNSAQAELHFDKKKCWFSHNKKILISYSKNTKNQLFKQKNRFFEKFQDLTPIFFCTVFLRIKFSIRKCNKKNYENRHPRTCTPLLTQNKCDIDFPSLISIALELLYTKTCSNIYVTFILVQKIKKNKNIH